jgi:WXXGXW repeat (2 copies)
VSDLLKPLPPGKVAVMFISPRFLTRLGLAVTLLLGARFAPAQPPTFPPARTPDEAGDVPPVPNEDMAVQPRGPVHEAFAQPWGAVTQPGPVITRKPPAPIPETPPEQRPEGDNVVWIPGYWAWDADRSDFLWISGVWRLPPTGRRWVPGTWNAVEGGYQWTPGLWAPAGQEEMPFLAQPPDSLDNGPSSPAPGDDSFYVPGNWLSQGSQYAWQPGYWQTYRPGMMWMPSYYSWTPGGYLFVPGYWDWPLANRGLMFAPMMFNRPLWNTPGWSYQPSYVVPYGSLLSSLFMGPTGYGYYFGNYYGPSYYRMGYRPWFGGGWGNPLFSWYRWYNRGNGGWYPGLQSAYRGRYNGTLTRPPLTLVQQNTLLNNNVNVQNNVFNTLRMVQPLNQFNGVRLNRLNAAQIAAYRNGAQNFHQFSAQRQNLQGTAFRRDSRRSLPLTQSLSRGNPGLVGPGHALASPGGTSRLNPGIGSPHPIPPVQLHHGVASPHPIPPAQLHHGVASPHPQAANMHHGAPSVAHHAAPAVHHATPAIQHTAPAVHHAAPAVHHSAPAVHHAAPAAHHAAPASHGGGGHGGHHR